jgi:carbonic anhydrase
MRALKSIVGSVVAACLLTTGGAWGTDWGYECLDCPTNWGNLDPAFSACIEGRVQSPIAFDKKSAKRVDLPRLVVDYGKSRLEVERLRVNFEAFVEEQRELGIRIGRKKYALVQFHFHSAAEHVVNGERAPLELHFVHRAEDGELAVLGVFIKAGDRLKDMDELIDVLDEVVAAAPGEHVETEWVDVDDLVPSDNDTYRYVGSTTTPPCVEGVQWNLLDDPMEMSGEQIAAIQDAIRAMNNGFDNNRPIQNRNGRRILTDD